MCLSLGEQPLRCGHAWLHVLSTQRRPGLYTHCRTDATLLMYSIPRLWPSGLYTAMLIKWPWTATYRDLKAARALYKYMRDSAGLKRLSSRPISSRDINHDADPVLAPALHH